MAAKYSVKLHLTSGSAVEGTFKTESQSLKTALTECVSQKIGNTPAVILARKPVNALPGLVVVPVGSILAYEIY